MRACALCVFVRKLLMCPDSVLKYMFQYVLDRAHVIQPAHFDQRKEGNKSRGVLGGERRVG